MPAAFTPAEVAALFDLDEKEVRREIELEVLEARKPPVRFSFAEAVYLLVIHRLGVQFGVPERRRLHALIERAASSGRTSRVDFSPALDVKLGPSFTEVSTKGDRFEAWKHDRVVEDENILAGEPTFRGTRLAVRKVGAMIERHGEKAVKEIREDYPYLRLSEEDIEFAPRFVRAYPRRGRPREAPQGEWSR